MDMYSISMMAIISFKMIAMRCIPQFFRYSTKELIPIHNILSINLMGSSHLNP